MGTIHPQMRIPSPFSQPKLALIKYISSFEHKKKLFWKMLVEKKKKNIVIDIHCKNKNKYYGQCVWGNALQVTQVM